MRRITEYNSTANSTVWRRLHKFFHARCDRCPWHRWENATRQGTKKLNKRQRGKRQPRQS